MKLYMYAVVDEYNGNGFRVHACEHSEISDEKWLLLGEFEIDVPMSDDDIRAHFASNAKAAAIAKVAAAQAELEALNAIL